MSDFIRSDGSNMIFRYGGDGNGVAGESHKLHLENLAILMDEDDGSDITGLKALFRQVGGQHDAFMFMEHSELRATGRR